MAMPTSEIQFHRYDGPDPEGPVYFLPWHVRFDVAMRLGLVAVSRWRSCYELPDNIVCPEPDVCARSIRLIEHDVRLCGRPKLVIGFSMGTVPATYIAGRFECRLWSFASADRGELMLWSSSKACAVRALAEQRGFGADDFARSLEGLNPVNCIERVHPKSRLVTGIFDRYIPRARTAALIQQARRRLSQDRIYRLPVGHLGVLLASRWLQKRWAVSDLGAK